MAKATHALVGHEGGIASVAFSIDGTTLASGSWDDTIRVWDARTGRHLQTIDEHKDGVRSVAFSLNGLTLASGSEDGTIRLWDANAGEHLRTIEGHMGEVTSIAFSPDELTLASGSADGTILLWDLMRAATWGDAKQIAVTDGMRRLPEHSPFAAPLASTETALLPNYPNPFNPETWIPYQLGRPSEVVLTIYDTNGQKVRTLDVGHQPSGVYESLERAAYWDGRNEMGETVANGVYFCTLNAGNFSATRKMMVGK